MGEEADSKDFWLGMMWNGSLTDLQGNTLGYTPSWYHVPGTTYESPAVPTIPVDGQQCLVYSTKSGKIRNDITCNRVIIPTMCV